MIHLDVMDKGILILLAMILLLPLRAEEEMSTEFLKVPNDFLQQIEAEEEKNRKIEITLEPKADGDIRDVVIHFRNISDHTVHILRTLDGSLQGLYYPHYTFSVSNLNSEEAVPRAGGGCGNRFGLYDGLKWPEDYLISIEPNETYSRSMKIPYQLKSSESYSVRFEYLIPKYILSEKRPLRDTKGNWYRYPLNIWTGSVKTEPLVINHNQTEVATP
ncbi:hypothetical protein DDZ13_15095 [Coraliomargarita sinensis]|uniref:Uncharacterized protein n=1 Tax=Coraliomargarita sinensis TaxID=2174842 RepID=A0A317ZDQ2_9BACT|nr:hypothetical protein [Coraliomargarita sinensis]PXA02832.1 hypothetical protein DDZ13_15095 [Coraliomargarita sinensis]